MSKPRTAPIGIATTTSTIATASIVVRTPPRMIRPRSPVARRPDSAAVLADRYARKLG
jgi:hypothetical protein